MARCRGVYASSWELERRADGELGRTHRVPRVSATHTGDGGQRLLVNILYSINTQASGIPNASLPGV